MSRTFRHISSHRIKMGENSNIKVRDGSYTHSVRSCQRHGGCKWCLSNRTHKNNKRIPNI